MSTGLPLPLRWPGKMGKPLGYYLLITAVFILTWLGSIRKAQDCLALFENAGFPGTGNEIRIAARIPQGVPRVVLHPSTL